MWKPLKSLFSPNPCQMKHRKLLLTLLWVNVMQLAVWLWSHSHPTPLAISRSYKERHMFQNVMQLAVWLVPLTPHLSLSAVHIRNITCFKMWCNWQCDSGPTHTPHLSLSAVHIRNVTCFKPTYRSFATRVSQLKIWHLCVIGVEGNIRRCTFNRYSVITQFAKLTTGEQLCCCCCCTYRKL